MRRSACRSAARCVTIYQYIFPTSDPIVRTYARTHPQTFAYMCLCAYVRVRDSVYATACTRQRVRACTRPTSHRIFALRVYSRTNYPTAWLGQPAIPALRAACLRYARRSASPTCPRSAYAWRPFVRTADTAGRLRIRWTCVTRPAILQKLPQ